MDGTANNLVSSDSSSESLEHFDDPRNHKEAEIEGNISKGMNLGIVNGNSCNDQNDHKTVKESVFEISHPQARTNAVRNLSIFTICVEVSNAFMNTNAKPT